MQSIPWLDLPIASSFDDSHVIDIKIRSEMVGGNTGNLLFRHGIKLVLERAFGIKLIPTVFSNLSHAKVKNAVVSCANWLAEKNTRFDSYCKNRHDYLLDSDVETLLFVGLGCNSPTSDPSKFELGENSLALAKYASAKSKFILTRDVFTKEVLNIHGITNAINLGCPSNLITDFVNNASARTRLMTKAKYLSNRKDLLSEQFILTQLEVLKPSQKLLDIFAACAGKNNFSYVFQGTSGDQFVFEKSKDMHVLDLEKSLKKMRFSLEEVFELNPGLFRTFYDASQWIGFCSGKAFSIGPRLHGAIVSLQSGTPAFLCTHDQRTRGLADQLRLPVWDENVTDLDEISTDLVDLIHYYIEGQSIQKELFISTLAECLL